MNHMRGDRSESVPELQKKILHSKTDFAKTCRGRNTTPSSRQAVAASDSGLADRAECFLAVTSLSDRPEPADVSANSSM